MELDDEGEAEPLSTKSNAAANAFFFSARTAL